MKPFGKIESQAWDRFRYDGLSIEAKLLAVYLLTNKHSNMIGVYSLPVLYIAGDLELDQETVCQLLDELKSKDFITVSEQFEFIAINRFQHYNPPANRNTFVARLAAFEALPSMSINLSEPLRLLAETARDYKECASFLNRIETVGKRFENLGCQESKPLNDLGGERKREREKERKRVREKRDMCSLTTARPPRTG